MLQSLIKMIRYPLLLTVLVSLASCSSVIFNPSVIMPSEPLKKDNFQVIAGAGIYPVINQRNSGRLEDADLNVQRDDFKPAGDLTFRYGFSSYFSLQARGWMNLRSIIYDETALSGYSVSAFIILNDSSSIYRLALIPTVAWMFSANTNEATGFSLLAGIWLPDYSVFYPYATAGLVYGTRNFEQNMQGYGIMSNLGTAVKLKPIAGPLEFNIELSFLGYKNDRRGAYNYIIVPNATLSYKF